MVAVAVVVVVAAAAVGEWEGWEVGAETALAVPSLWECIPW